MEIKEKKTVCVRFTKTERMILDSAIRSRVGEMTINKILDGYSLVFPWYRNLFDILPRIYSGDDVHLDYQQYSILIGLLMDALNKNEGCDSNTIRQMLETLTALRDLCV